MCVGVQCGVGVQVFAKYRNSDRRAAAVNFVKFRPLCTKIHLTCTKSRNFAPTCGRHHISLSHRQVFLKSHSFIHFLDTHVGITEPKSQVHLRKSRVVRQSCAAQRAAHKIYEFVQNFTPRAQKICEIISHLLHEILAWAKLVGDPDDDEARGDGGGRASGE